MSHEGPDHVSRIDNNYHFIIQCLEPRDIDSLTVQEGCIPYEDMEEVCIPALRRDRAKKYFAALRRHIQRSDTCYPRFLEVLKAYGGYEMLIQKLNETVIQPLPQDIFVWISELDDRTKQHSPSQAECAKLSKAIGRGWERLMLELGFRRNEIEHEKAGNHNTDLCVVYLLIKWTHRESRAATMQVLLEKMKELDRDIDIEWDILREKVDNIVRTLNPV